MKQFYRLTSALNRYTLCIINLGFLSCVKIIFFRFVKSKEITCLATKKFKKIYFRPSGDFGVLTHFFTPQINFSVETNQIKTIFDIGANIGTQSKRFEKLFPMSKIISVELEKNNFELLKKNTDGSDNIIPLNYAIWNSNSEVKVFEKEGGNNQSFKVKTLETKKNTEVVKSITVDALMNEFKVKHIDLLKIDIEGAEKVIFDKSCDNWIASVDIIVMECPDDDAPLTVQKVFEAFRRNAIAVNTYVNGEHIVFCKKGIQAKPTTVEIY